MSTMSKTRINLYLDEAIGEAFKRYCRSKKKSYSEIAEGLFYRLLITPQTTSSNSTLSLQQENLHNQAVNAYREVYDANRQSTIQTALESSKSEPVEEVSPQIPMPIPTPSSQGGVNHGIQTNHLSKRNRG